MYDWVLIILIQSYILFINVKLFVWLYYKFTSPYLQAFKINTSFRKQDKEKWLENDGNYSFLTV